MDNLICKTQAHARVCKENKLDKNDCPLKEVSLKHRLLGTTQESPKKLVLVCLFVMMLHSIKVLTLYYIYTIMYIHVIAEYWP